MLVCPDRKFVVILPARCGTTSVKEAFKARFRCQEYGPNHGVNIRPEHRPFYKVCLTRNPYTRVVSLWKHWLGRQSTKPYKNSLDQLVQQHITDAKLSFEELLLQPKPCQALLEVCTPIAKLTQDIKINAWIAQERLADELSQLPFLDGNPLLLPQRHRSTYDRSWQSLYTPQLQEQVYQLYRADFDLFNYPQEIQA